MPELRISLRADQPLTLPIAHQHALQAMFYHALSLGDPLMSRMLHERKPDFNNRTYSPFVFSRLYGSKTLNGKEVTYQGALSLSIRSFSPTLLTAWKNGFSSWGEIELLHKTIPIVKTEIIEYADIPSESAVKMLTPIIVHHTQDNGGTRYLSPEDPDFYRYVCANSERKWEALTGRRLPGKVALKPLKVSPFHRCITTFKQASVCGWYGTYLLSASPEVIRLLLETGLGERNGQGFGYFNLIQPSPH